MKNFILCLTFLLLFSDLISQSILDNEFQWEENESCQVSEFSGGVYKKVEIDPKLDTYSEEEFKLFVENLAKDLNFQAQQSGTIKLKFLFLLNQQICVKKIGVKDIALSKSQKELIVNRFENINSFLPGIQRNQIKVCQGIIYLTVENSKILKFRNVNFKFKDG